MLTEMDEAKTKNEKKKKQKYVNYTLIMHSAGSPTALSVHQKII